MAVTVGPEPPQVSGTARSVYNTRLPNTPYVVTNVATGAAVSIYSDADLTTVIASPRSDYNGVYRFYVPSGTYSIAFTSAIAGEPADNPPNFTVRRAVLTRVLSGLGSPEAAVTAPVGTLYTREDGSTSTTLYVKETGVGNTGWVAK